MGSHPVILNGKGAAAVVITAWASWVPAVSVLCYRPLEVRLMTSIFRVCWLLQRERERQRETRAFQGGRGSVVYTHKIVVRILYIYCI